MDMVTGGDVAAVAIDTAPTFSGLCERFVRTRSAIPARTATTLAGQQHHLL